MTEIELSVNFAINHVPFVENGENKVALISPLWSGSDNNQNIPTITLEKVMENFVEMWNDEPEVLKKQLEMMKAIIIKGISQ